MTLVGTIKHSVIILALCMLALLSVIIWSFSTTEGTRQALETAKQHLQHVNYQFESGNFRDGIKLSTVQWQLKNGTDVSGEGLYIVSDAYCWSRKTLCINEGTIERLVIDLPVSDNLSNKITLSELSLPLSVQAKNVSIQQLIFTHPQRPEIIFENVEFSGSITQSNIVIDSLTTEWNNVQLESSGTITMQNSYPVELSGTAQRLNSTSDIQTGWAASGDLASLQLDANLQQPFNATLTGAVSLLDKSFPAQMTMRWDTLSIPFKQPAANISDTYISITGTWPNYDVEGKARYEGAALPYGTAQLRGTVSTRSLQLTPLTLNTMGGTLRGIGSVNWEHDLRWNTDLEIDNINTAWKWPELDGKFSGISQFTGLISNNRSEIHLSNIVTHGRLKGHAFRVTGNVFKDDDNHWNLENLQANSTSNHASANGRIGESVKLVFSLNSPQDFSDDLHGDLHGEITLSGDINRPGVDGSISSGHLKYKNIEVRNARIKGMARELADATSDLLFQAESLSVDQQRFEHPTVAIGGSLDDHVAQLSFTSAPLNTTEIKLKGSVDEHFNWNGKINSVRSSVADRSLSLAQPFTATWVNENRNLALQPHCWLFDYASVCVKESALIGKSGAILFGINQVPLKSFAEFVPDKLQIDGTLQSDGKLNWGPNQKTSVTIETSLQNAAVTVISSEGTENIPVKLSKAELQVSTRNNKIHAQLAVESDKFDSLNAIVNIDTRDKSLPLNGSLSLTDSRIDWLKDHLSDVKLINGLLSGTGTIFGTLKAPEFEGDVKLKSGQLRINSIPVKFEDLIVDAAVTGRNATIKGRGLANNSPLTLNGTSSFTESGLNSELKLSAKYIKIQQKHITDAIVSPTLVFKVEPEITKIFGDVDVRSATITLQNKNSEGVALSKDVIIVDDQENTAGSEVVGSKGVYTNVNINLGKDVTVSGYGLNADVDGGFRFVLDSNKPPQLAGTIAIDNGSYEAYGQKLAINEGEITFTGPVEQTTVSGEAVRTTKEVMAGVRINGTLQNPSTELFSQPSLPEDEILSYVVLGRKIDFGSQDSDLIQRAALLLGVKTGQKVSTTLARNLGIDNFSLSAWGTGEDTQILLSGRINDRLLVRYGVGIFNENNSLYLRYDLDDKLYLETTQGLESAVDLFYSFDF